MKVVAKRHIEMYNFTYGDFLKFLHYLINKVISKGHFFVFLYWIFQIVHLLIYLEVHNNLNSLLLGCSYQLIE